MKRMKRWFCMLLALCMLFAAMPLTAAQELSSAEMASATPLTLGQTVNMSLDAYESVCYSIQTTKPGQIIRYELTNINGDYGVSMFNSNGNFLSSRTFLRNNDRSNYVCAPSAGTYYLEFYTYNDTASGSLTVTLVDNDSHEPNNTQKTATALQSGKPVDLILAPSDEDWLMIETTKDGQDIQVNIGGFNYANKGELWLSFDGILYPLLDDYYGYISGNGTHYFHAAKAGKHYLWLYDCSPTSGSSLPFTVTATVLDGDANECNDTKQTATALSLGTDLRFSVGGWGDEDWFRFETAPDADGNTLYTLQFLDLNPNYSDELYYEVYSPDDTLLTSRTHININHSQVLGCTKEGVYYIRVLTIRETGNSYAYSDIDTITRSTLRLRVSKGGSDPHESNDTWLTATPIQAGQLTQHVLSSTSDADWFRFTVPEADMSFALEMSHNTYAQIYRAADLAEHGEDAESFFSSYRSNGSENLYCKLAEPGVYYLKLKTVASYATEDLRSLTVTLDSPGDEENNDTWDRAVLLYDGAPQTFSIAGGNDKDWFKFKLDSNSLFILSLSGNFNISTCQYQLYREADILYAGLSASPVESSMFYSSSNDTYLLEAGTYYLKITDYNDGASRTGICTVQYTLSPVDGSTLADAAPLAEGQWSDNLPGMRYYSLGELKEGDTVRVSRDANGGSPNFYLVASNAEHVQNNQYYRGSSKSWSIPADGTYYLEVYATNTHDENGDQIPSRVRYFVSSGSGSATAIDGPDELTLYVGQKQFVDLHLSPEGASGNEISLYNNSNSNVASYSGYSGYITANAVGTTTMKFRAYTGSDYIYKYVVVTVKDVVPATAVSIDNAPTSMRVGERVYLHAHLTPDESAEKITWSSSDPKVLYVFPGGKAVAVGEGTATVTATVGALTDTQTVTVQPAAPTVEQITSLLLDRYAITMYLGEGTQKLTATVQPAGIDTTIVWISSNTAAATIDQTGVISAIAPGVSIITAAAGDHNVSCVVTVQAPRVRVSGISFAEPSLQLPLGGETVLTPTISPYNATTKTLTWVSDDTAVASVSRTGIVHALAVGRTTIRATTLDGGFAAELTIEVTAAPQPGDINGDGYVDAGDAILCLRHAVGLIELTTQQKSAGDVNRDGFVDAGDAVRILRYNAKLIDSLR